MSVVRSRKARKWTIRENTRNIHVIDITLPHVGDEQSVLLQSDVHVDNPHCDRDLLLAHLDEARERDAPILDNGDWFCAMGGKWDKRSNKSELRPEHQNARYLDSLVEESAKILKPYHDLLTVRGRGNHETAITKHHETDLTDRLAYRLRSDGAPHVYTGGYSGFVVFNIKHDGTRERPFKLHYHHGFGGGGAVTRGVIQTNRQAVYLADADMVWTGHTHDSWLVPIARVRLNHHCNVIEHTTQVHIRTAGYKNEYADGYGGWHIERGAAPKPIGAAWVTFKHKGKPKNAPSKIDFDIVEAK